MNKIVVVFGSGVISQDSEPFRIAYEAGLLLARAGFAVANGGYSGSMLAVSKGVKEAFGHTIGVTTDDFNSRPNRFIDREIRKKTWQERLHELIRIGDGYLVLDGGTGTLTELAVVWEMGNKGFHQKPVVILGRYFTSAVKTLLHNPEMRLPKTFYFAPSPKAATEYLTKYFKHV